MFLLFNMISFVVVCRLPAVIGVCDLTLSPQLLQSGLIKYWTILCCDSAGHNLSVLFQRSMKDRTRFIMLT